MNHKIHYFPDSLHELSYLFAITVGNVNTGETVSNNVQRKCHGFYEVLFKNCSGFANKMRQQLKSIRAVQTDFCTGLTYLLTPWSGVHLEKLTSCQLVKKFSAFTSAWHLSLS
jgi:hypothetical protein